MSDDTETKPQQGRVVLGSWGTGRIRAIVSVPRDWSELPGVCGQLMPGGPFVEAIGTDYADALQKLQTHLGKLWLLDQASEQAGRKELPAGFAAGAGGYDAP